MPLWGLSGAVPAPVPRSSYAANATAQRLGRVTITAVPVTSIDDAVRLHLAL